jgi:hypothetical protein
LEIFQILVKGKEERGNKFCFDKIKCGKGIGFGFFRYGKLKGNLKNKIWR